MPGQLNRSGMSEARAEDAGSRLQLLAGDQPNPAEEPTRRQSTSDQRRRYRQPRSAARNGRGRSRRYGPECMSHAMLTRRGHSARGVRFLEEKHPRGPPPRAAPAVRRRTRERMHGTRVTTTVGAGVRATTKALLSPRRRSRSPLAPGYEQIHESRQADGG